MMTPEREPAGFDHYAAQYDAALARGVSVSGEDKLFFAKGRIAWLAQCLQQHRAVPRHVLDFGCGTGTATPYFFELLHSERVIGVDISAESLAVAKAKQSMAAAEFLTFGEYTPRADLDLVFCNGVFHHIPPPERADVVNYIWRCLRPGGWLALWENNPWNPGTRFVMSRIPFDRDAITLTPPETRRLLATGGWKVVETTFQFVFPRPLKWLRGLEAPLARWPLGAQYQVLARKPR